MKIRLKGAAIRIRLTRGELSRLVEIGRVQEVTPLGIGAAHHLVFAVQSSVQAREVTLRNKGNETVIFLPAAAVARWHNTDLIGLEGSQHVGDGQELTILVEKDFMCLEHRDEDADAFPNPALGAKC